MKETLICSLEKHNIYYLNDANCGFYILTPYKEFKETNIAIRLKSNYRNYDLSNNSLDTVTNELINYYKSLDNYNITLILPIFYDDSLLRIRTVDDMNIYQRIDSYLGYMFNNAYRFLTSKGIKVNSKIYMINNDSFKRFTNWFVAKYGNRIEYKTVVDLVKSSGSYDSFDMVKTPNINFVVGKAAEAKIDKTVDIETEVFNNYAKDPPIKSRERKETKDNAGFVSYILLGAITFVLSILMLYIFVK